MTKFLIFKDAKGEYRWRLVAPNGRTIAVPGEGYETMQGLKNDIRLVKLSFMAKIKEKK